MEVSVNGKDEILRTPFTMIVCGQSGSGKTQFIFNILKHMAILMSGEDTFERIIYAYGIYQDLYLELAKFDNVELVEGVPDLSSSGSDKKTLLILDDLFLETDKK